jgi:hypothetical protein
MSFIITFVDARTYFYDTDSFSPKSKKMEQFILKLKDSSKRNFLLELLQQFDFIELQIADKGRRVSDKNYDFFKSAGLFEGRDLDADQLRKGAWRIKK